MSSDHNLFLDFTWKERVLEVLNLLGEPSEVHHLSDIYRLMAKISGLEIHSIRQAIIRRSLQDLKKKGLVRQGGAPGFWGLSDHWWS